MYLQAIRNMDNISLFLSYTNYSLLLFDEKKISSHETNNNKRGIFETKTE